MPTCGGLEAGVMTARGVALRDARLQRRGFAVARIGSGVAWGRGRFRLWGRPELAIALTRPRFAAEGVGVLHEVEVLGLRAFFGLEVRFP